MKNKKKIYDGVTTTALRYYPEYKATLASDGYYPEHLLEEQKRIPRAKPRDELPYDLFENQLIEYQQGKRTKIARGMTVYRVHTYTHKVRWDSTIKVKDDGQICIVIDPDDGKTYAVVPLELEGRRWRLVEEVDVDL